MKLVLGLSLVLVAGCVVTREPEVPRPRRAHVEVAAPVVEPVQRPQPLEFVPSPTPLTCKERFAPEMARAQARVDEATRVAQEKIDATCHETVTRDTRRWVNGREVSGPTRMAWICNGVPMNEKPVADGGVTVNGIGGVAKKIVRCQNEEHE